MNYEALKVELLAGHPVTGAYNVDDALALAECNAVNIIRDRVSLSAAAIFDEILKERAEWDALGTDATRQWVRDILSINSIEGISTVVSSPARVELIATLGTNTKAAIALLIPETVSQMTVLGFGAAIIIGDVQNARAL